VVKAVEGLIGVLLGAEEVAEAVLRGLSDEGRCVPRKTGRGAGEGIQIVGKRGEQGSASLVK